MVRSPLALLLCSSVTAKSYFKGYRRLPKNEDIPVAEITDEMRAAAPASLDWSTAGATSAVKDQGSCGSCWAYSATEGIESAVFMATGSVVALSEQQIVSCDSVDGGCFGGDLPSAFKYVKDAGGIATQEDYPDTSSQTGEDGTCNAESTPAVQLTGYKYAIPPCPRGGSCEDQQESDMMTALHAFGPLSVCVNANKWSSYRGGIYKGSGLLRKTCSGAEQKLDHCVQLVGYDTTGSESYWKVRNSWASDWGEEGFIRLPMGRNFCGIADEAMFVEVSAQV